MTNRQKDAATTHAKHTTLKLISVSAVALLIGIGAAAAQGGASRETEHNIEKKKDNELLTPIRPLPRKVGETSWPEPKPEAQREANERKAAPTRETTGQSMSAQSEKPQPPNNTAANNPPNNTPQPAQNNQAATHQPQPQNTQPQQTQNTQPQPATAQNNARPQQQQPAQNNQAAQQPQQTNTAQPAQPPQPAQPSQNTAQNAPAPNNAQPNQPNAQQPAQQNAQQQQQNTQQAQSNPQQDHASIRLGTDASGKVAINEDQEQQLAKALRRARPVEVNVGVQIGGPAPQRVRLAAVSADIVQVLPQFRGYSYFATAEQIYIVDPAANRVVAMVPVKLTATVKREAPSRTTVGTAPPQPDAQLRTTVGSAPAPPTAQPEPSAAPAHTATVTTAAPEPRSRRSTRRDDDLAGIEAAIEREVQRKGLGGERGRTVVIEEAPAVQRVPTRRWRPWFAGGGDVQ